MLLLEGNEKLFQGSHYIFFPFCPQFVMIWTDDLQLVFVNPRVSRVVVVAIGKL
jgi:hypothetical protein